MLILSGLLAIGIQLLIKTQVSYSLVLLTANLEDIKKIAKQFVSETVADQIAKFLVQTSVNHTINISEENNLNDDVNKVSDEYWEVPRANKSSSEDVEKLLRHAMERVEEMKDVVNDVTKSRSKKQPENENRRDQEDSISKKSTTKKSSDNYIYDFILTPEKTKKPKYEWKKGLNLDFLSTPNIFKQNEIYNSFTRGTISDKEDNNSDFNKIDNLSSNHETKRRSKKSFQRLQPKIQRLVKVISKPIKEDVITERSKLNIEREEAISTTTQAEENKTENNILDYYDNSIYIKKEIVATSGPIELVKVTSLKREMSSSSSEYLSDNVNEDKKKLDVNIDLYFRKLLDKKLKQYKNNTREIQTRIATNNFDTSNRAIDKDGVETTKENVPLKNLSNINRTVSKQHHYRRMKEETTVDDLSYFDESYDIYY